MPAREILFDGDYGPRHLTSVEFDQLAALWKQEPDAFERRELAGLARRATRTARFLQYAEFVVGLLLGLGILAALFVQPVPLSLALGLPVVVTVFWYSWKSHALGNLALLVDRSGRDAFVESMARSKAAHLARSTIGLCLFLPTIVVTSMAIHSWKGGTLDGYVQAMALAMTKTGGIVTMVVLLVALLLFIRTNLRLRQELGRLQLLCGEYREETRFAAEPG